MSGSSSNAPSEGTSQSAFETAVEVLSGFRDGNPALPPPLPSPSAHLIPRTPEEFAYIDCDKLSVKTSMANVRAELGVPQSTTKSTNMINNFKWEQLSELVARLSQEFDFDDESVSNLTQISQAIEASAQWKDCEPRRPVSAFVPVLISRWKKNRRDRPNQRKAGAQ
ncbi:hypothetical protein TWF281_011024 [Arthrobotrys megalospora]